MSRVFLFALDIALCLCGEKLEVAALLFHQSFVVANLDHLAVFQHNDLGGDGGT